MASSRATRSPSRWAHSTASSIRADPRVLAAMVVEIDELGGDPHGGQDTLHESGALPDQRDHRTVVIGVALDVEDAHSGDRAGGPDDPLDGGFAPALREVRDEHE